MKRLVSITCLFCVLVVLAAAPAFAGKKFDITYRLDDVATSETTASGHLMLYVLNASGEPAKDVAIWIEGPNNVTFNNRAIHVGDLADGQPLGVMDEFSVPIEIAHPEDTEEEIVWKVEFTKATGERTVLDADGRRVR